MLKASCSKTTLRRRAKKAMALGVDVSELTDGRGKGQHASSGQHYRWNNRKMLDSQGYVIVRVGKTHPLADLNGYVREHVLVVVSSESPGASLLLRHPREFVIHHENGNRQDNRLDNLTVMARADHNRLHNQTCRARDDNGRFVGKHTAGRVLDGRMWGGVPGKRTQ